MRSWKRIILGRLQADPLCGSPSSEEEKLRSAWKMAELNCIYLFRNKTKDILHMPRGTQSLPKVG